MRARFAEVNLRLRSLSILVAVVAPVGALRGQECDTKQLNVGAASGVAGDEVEVVVAGGVSCEVTGFSLAIGHDVAVVSFVGAEPGEFLTTHAGDQLFFQVTERNADGFAVVGAIFDLTFPLTIPPTTIEAGSELVRLRYRIDASAAPGITALLNRTLTYGGDNPIANVFSAVPGQPPIEPDLGDGSIEVSADTPALAFRRGDSNDDAQIDVSDAVYGLLYLFSGGPPPACFDAADSNDDGDVDLADAIHLLGSLFVSGDPPPPPGGECGVDPTADPLSCAESACFE